MSRRSRDRFARCGSTYQRQWGKVGSSEVRLPTIQQVNDSHANKDQRQCKQRELA